MTAAAAPTGLLQGQNVLVAGVGRNIGRAVALAAAEQGAGVYFTDVAPEPLAALSRELKRFPVPSYGFRSDITSEADVVDLCNTLHGRGAAIDILVNNVGIDPDAEALGGSSQARWRRILDTNLIGPVHLTERVTRRMIDEGRRGAVVFVSSIHQWAVRGRPGYSASKAAMGMAIKELAVELAPHGIRVNGIAPGYVKQDAAGDPLRHRYTPLHGTSIPPRYVGRAAVHLASEYFSAYTTGAVLTLDAGLSLYNHLMAQEERAAQPPPAP